MLNYLMNVYNYLKAKINSSSFKSSKPEINLEMKKEFVDYIPNENPSIVSFTGFHRCGKDTAAKIVQSFLESKGLRVKKFAFAQYLKEYCAKTLGISVEELEEMKNNNDLIQLQDSKLTSREYIILLGNALRKTLNNEGFWGELVIKEIEENIGKDFDIAIITDARFKIEFDLIKNQSKNNLIIRVDSDLDDCFYNDNEKDIELIEENPSEKTYFVYNKKGELDQFKDKLEKIIEKEINNATNATNASSTTSTTNAK